MFQGNYFTRKGIMLKASFYCQIFKHLSDLVYITSVMKIKKKQLCSCGKNYKRNSEI